MTMPKFGTVFTSKRVNKNKKEKFTIAVFWNEKWGAKPEENAENPDYESEQQTAGFEMHELLPDYIDKEWYYLDTNRQQQGPVQFDRLKATWRDGKLTSETFVWSEGMDNWKKVDELPGFLETLTV